MQTHEVTLAVKNITTSEASELVGYSVNLINKRIHTSPKYIRICCQECVCLCNKYEKHVLQLCRCIYIQVRCSVLCIACHCNSLLKSSWYCTSSP